MPPPPKRPPSPKVRGVKSYKVKGQVYYYHRKTKTRIREEFGTAAFLLKVADLDAKQPKLEAGSFARLIDAYKKSNLWTDLAPATRISYERAFVALSGVRDRPIKLFTSPFIARLRDLVLEQHGRWMANYALTVLVILFDFAREKGSVDSNPARGVRHLKKDKSRPVANRPWEAAECRAVLDAAPPYLAVAIGLAMFAGFRKADVLSIGKEALITKKIRQGSKIVDFPFVSHKTAKRKVDVAFPIHPTLANALSAAPKHAKETIAATSRGEKWTDSGFNSTFGKLIDRLERAGKVGTGLTMHGLRHTVGTRLIEAGADLDDVRRLLGQQSTAMAQHYSRTADISERTAVLVGKMKVIAEVEDGAGES